MGRIMVLEDVSDAAIDGVIITTKFDLDDNDIEEVQKVIDEVKNSRADWNIEDIRDALPPEYELITRWDTDWHVITY